MSGKLEITKEKVLAAANTCTEAEKVLKTLFPEAFKDEIDLTRLLECHSYSLFNCEGAIKAGFRDNSFMEIRSSGQYAKKAFFLSKSYNWELKEDNNHYLCLIPTKK
jgi:hypothetical protein